MTPAPRGLWIPQKVTRSPPSQPTKEEKSVTLVKPTRQEVALSTARGLPRRYHSTVTHATPTQRIQFAPDTKNRNHKRSPDDTNPKTLQWSKVGNVSQTSRKSRQTTSAVTRLAANLATKSPQKSLFKTQNDPTHPSHSEPATTMNSTSPTPNKSHLKRTSTSNEGYQFSSHAPPPAIVQAALRCRWSTRRQCVCDCKAASSGERRRTEKKINKYGA